MSAADPNKWSIKVSDDKYEYVYENGRTYALRYGEPWRDLTGDNLIYFLAAELKEAKDNLAKLRVTIEEMTETANMDNPMAGEDI